MCRCIHSTHLISIQSSFKNNKLDQKRISIFFLQLKVSESNRKGFPHPSLAHVLYYVCISNENKIVKTLYNWKCEYNAWDIIKTTITSKNTSADLKYMWNNGGTMNTNSNECYFTILVFSWLFFFLFFILAFGRCHFKHVNREWNLVNKTHRIKCVFQCWREERRRKKNGRKKNPNQKQCYSERMQNEF